MGDDQPAYNPYGRPGSYRAGQEPGQYTSSPLTGQSYGAAGQWPPAYNPYGGSYPAGLDQVSESPAQRPGLMVLALVLMILAALPFLVAGVSGLAGVDAESISSEMLKNPQLAAAGATPELVNSLLRVVSGVLLVGSLLYLVLAVVAFRGRNWARIAVSVLSAGFALLLLAGLAGAGGVAGGLGLILFVLVAVLGGVVILYLPDANRYFAAPRR